jgi:biopolymer transport protein TolR
MAINISKNNSRRGRGRLMSEINVTPMVDVMLVLLIIFMVTSPMLVAGVEVDLPSLLSR